MPGPAVGLCLIMVLLVACIVPGMLNAATYITPYISIGEIYSDNVDLSPGGSEDEDYVTEAAPGITIERSGSRLQALLDYRAQMFYFANRSDQNVYHQADGIGVLEVTDEVLFLNAKLKSTQSIVDPAGRLPTGNISRTGNTTDVYSYSVGPEFRQNFGSAAILGTNYTYRKVTYSENGLSDSTSNKVEADLESGPGFNKMGWRLELSWDKQDFDSTSDKEFRKVISEVSYPRDRPLTYIATAGYEDNDFETAASRSKPSGSLWTVGFEWVPNSRFRMNAAAGKRFFGTTVEAEMELQGRKDQIRASYSEDPKTASDALTEDSGPPLTGIPGDPTDIDPTAPGITDEVYVRKRFRLFHIHNFRRSDFWWTALLENREYQESGSDERVLRFNADWIWRLGAVTSLRTSGSWQDRDLRDINSDYNLWYVRVGLVRELGLMASAELDYRYSDRDGDNDNNDYTENRISARLLFAF